MKTGVSTLPWESVRRLRRARPSLERISNCMSGLRARVRAGTIDQHGIAVTEKAVAFIDRVPISVADMLDSGKGADQHQQGGSRQMKVGQQAINYLETVSGSDEQPGLAITGFQLTGVCGGFQRAQTGRADRGDAAAAPERGSNRLRRCFGNRIMLAVHDMTLHFVDPHRLERARADMQGDVSQTHTEIGRASCRERV